MGLLSRSDSTTTQAILINSGNANACTGAGGLRDAERMAGLTESALGLPAGAVFAPLELVYSVYLPGDLDLFAHLLTALKLVEGDYLGGQGSRGSGKVAFEGLSLTVYGGEAYRELGECAFDLSDAGQKEAVTWIVETLPVPAH